MDILVLLNDEQILQVALECILHSENRSAIQSAEAILTSYIVLKEGEQLKEELSEEEFLDVLQQRTGEEIGKYAYEYLCKEGLAEADFETSTYDLNIKGVKFMKKLIEKRTLLRDEYGEK